MFGRSLRLWVLSGGRPHWQQAARRSPAQPRHLCAAAGAGGALQQLARAGAGSGGRFFAGGTILGGGAVAAVTNASKEGDHGPEPAEQWLTELAGADGVVEVLRWDP